MLTNQQKFDRALILAAVYGTDFNDALTHCDPHHEQDAPAGAALVRRAGNCLKLQISAGCGFYRSFEVASDVPIDSADLTADSWYHGSNERYAPCVLYSIDASGYFDVDGRWVPAGDHKLAFGICGRQGTVIEVPEDLAKFVIASFSLSKLRNANNNLFEAVYPSDTDEDDEEESL